MTPILPKHMADRGDAIIDAILDAVDDQPEALRADLFAAIKAGDYSIRHEPQMVTARFPTVANGTVIEVALITSAMVPRSHHDA